MEVRRPVSEKKLQANRANAKRSTGPRTPAGKASVSRKPSVCWLCLVVLTIQLTTGIPESPSIVLPLDLSEIEAEEVAS